MLSLASYEHVRRSVSLTFHLVLVSFGQFRSMKSVPEFITTDPNLFLSCPRSPFKDRGSTPSPAYSLKFSKPLQSLKRTNLM